MRPPEAPTYVCPALSRESGLKSGLMLIPSETIQAQLWVKDHNEVILKALLAVCGNPFISVAVFWPMRRMIVSRDGERESGQSHRIDAYSVNVVAQSGIHNFDLIEHEQEWRTL